MGHKGLKMQVMDCCKVLGTNQETYGIEDVGYIDLCKVLGISQETYGTEDAGYELLQHVRDQLGDMWD